MKILNYLAALLVAFSFVSCKRQSPATAKNGIKEASSDVKTGKNGLTVEQNNIKSRLEAENSPGAIKHLYVISAMSGQVIIYSTVKGKVTSSGKRLTSPVMLKRGEHGSGMGDFVMPQLGEDGTYGRSISYLYWWDSQGRYHQHYVSGGQIVHISDEPLPVKAITINMNIGGE